MSSVLLYIWFIGFRELYGHDSFFPPVEFHQNVVYRVVDGEPVELDLWIPADAPAPLPAVVLLNGGAWAINDRTDYLDFGRGLARAGIIGVNLDFRPTPIDGFRGQTDDIKAGIRWLRANAAVYGIDPGRIGIYGSSSGGHLGALVTTAGHGEGFIDDPPGESSAVQAAFLLFGIYDLPRSPVTWINHALSGGIPFGIPPENLHVFSPLTYVNGNEPPTYMMHGERDLLVPMAEARRLHDALDAHGVPVNLHQVEGVGHGFIKTHPWLRPLIYWAVREFFRESL